MFPEETAIAAGTSAAQSVSRSILDDPNLAGAMQSQAVQDLDRIVTDNPGAANADTLNDANEYLNQHLNQPHGQAPLGYGGATPLSRRGSYQEKHWDHQTDMETMRRTDDRLQAAMASRRVRSSVHREQAHVLWQPSSESAFDAPLDPPIIVAPHNARPITREQTLYQLQAGRN